MRRLVSLAERGTYRADIDGLRAIAVLSVIIHHLESTLLPGGFVGVDIFFVISGYLITLNIIRDLEEGRFSFRDFYLRRIKRIMPAMLVVVAVTVVLAQFMLRPLDAEKVAESGLYALFSMGNVYFWLFEDTSYFAPDSNQIPLLHLWSLGVEEQYYLLWPLLFLFAFKFISYRYLFLLLVATALGSFFLGEILFHYDRLFTFYMLPTRAGELLLGSLSALLVSRGVLSKIPDSLATLSAVAGLFLITASLVTLNEHVVFPGWLAIMPTLGTALLITGGYRGDGWPVTILSAKPLVAVGLISYSAYLWHWPLLAFLSYVNFEIGILSGCMILVATLAMGRLSYLYIETPCRRSSQPWKKILVRQFILPVALISTLIIAIMKSDGFGIRLFWDDYRAQLAHSQAIFRPPGSYSYVCMRRRLTVADLEEERCVVGSELESSPQALLWGDSNAAHYVGMLGVFAKEFGVSIRNLEIGSCPPLLVDPEGFIYPRGLIDCRVSLKLARRAVDSYQFLIISADWQIYNSISGQFIDTFLGDIKRLVKAGKRVLLVGRIPVLLSFDEACDEKALSFPFMQCNPNASVGPLMKDIAMLNERLKSFATEEEGVEYFDANDYLCDSGKCSAYSADGKRLYRDSHHLNMPGSIELGKRIVDQEGVPYQFGKLFSP